MKVEAARLQVTLDALQQEKEMKVAIAEANTIEAGLLAEQESRNKSPSPVHSQN